MNDKTREILSRPFGKGLIKTRRGPGGKQLAYVELQAYIDRLNEAFEHRWSHEIVCREQFEDQVIIEVKLTADEITKTGIGGSAIHRNKNDGTIVSLAADFKIAEAEALKRAARSLGMAAELYKDEEIEIGEHVADARQQPANTNNDGRQPGGRVSKAQLSKMQELVGELGSDWQAFRKWVKSERQINVEYADKRLASDLIDDLIGRLRRKRSLNGSGPHNSIGGGQS